MVHQKISNDMRERALFFCLWKQNERLRGLQKPWACWREVLDVWKRSTMLYIAAWSLLNQSRDVLGCWQVIWLSSSLPDRVHCSEPSSSSSSTKEPSAFQSHLLLSVTCSSIVYVVYKRNMNFCYFQFRMTHGTWDTNKYLIFCQVPRHRRAYLYIQWHRLFHLSVHL